MEPKPTALDIVVVEDDEAIGEPLVEGLRHEGFRVRWLRTGFEALDSAGADIMLLDLGLPDLDGREVCRRVRERSRIPIIVVTAREDELDRVLLLELGADDYVVKPFGFRELVARVRAVLRRAGGPPSESPSALGGLRLDRAARRVWVDGSEVDLTAKEFDLLAMLTEQPGVVRTREQIIARVWDENWWGPTKTLDVHIASLRRKLGDSARITTLRGVGYRFDGSS